MKDRYSALLRNALQTVFKSFVSLHLDYGNIVYDQSSKQIS